MSESSTDAISQDSAYDLLSNSRRRYVISILRERDEPMALNELSRELAAWENDVDPAELTDQQIKRIYVSLYQTHIPKLSDAGVVSYDQETGTVELEDTVHELDTYIPGQNNGTTAWERLYILVAAVGLVLYGGSLVLPGGLFGLTPTIVGAVILLTFGLLTAAHYLSTKRS